MQLVHYSAEPVTAVRSVEQVAEPHFKPRGFWLSDDAAEQSWPEWCKGEDWGLERLALAHAVTLRADARILRAASAAEIDRLTKLYNAPLYPGCRFGQALDWARVATEYQGIIITPYIWSRRVDGEAGWYYTWDCASGCIWDAAAVESITPRLCGGGLT